MKTIFHYYLIFINNLNKLQAKQETERNWACNSGITYQLLANHLHMKIYGHEIRFLPYTSLKSWAQYICCWTDVRARDQICPTYSIIPWLYSKMNSVFSQFQFLLYDSICWSHFERSICCMGFQVWGPLVMLDVFKGIVWRAVDTDRRASRR